LKEWFFPGRSMFQSGKSTFKLAKTFLVRSRFDRAGGHLQFEDGAKNRKLFEHLKLKGGLPVAIRYF